MKRKESARSIHLEELQDKSGDSEYTSVIKKFLRNVGWNYLNKIDPTNKRDQAVEKALHRYEETLARSLETLPIEEHPESELVLHRPGTAEEGQQVVDFFKSQNIYVFPEVQYAVIDKVLNNLRTAGFSISINQASQIRKILEK